MPQVLNKMRTINKFNTSIFKRHSVSYIKTVIRSLPKIYIAEAFFDIGSATYVQFFEVEYFLIKVVITKMKACQLKIK